MALSLTRFDQTTEPQVISSLSWSSTPHDRIYAATAKMLQPPQSLLSPDPKLTDKFWLPGGWSTLGRAFQGDAFLDV
jgi:hypothetical protein